MLLTNSVIALIFQIQYYYKSVLFINLQDCQQWSNTDISTKSLSVVKFDTVYVILPYKENPRIMSGFSLLVPKTQ